MNYNDLSPRKETIIRQIAEGELASTNPNTIYTEQLTLGQKIADSVAQFGGSWPFILTAIAILSGWILVNIFSLISDSPFDPYPFILLNLGLSMLAALQAPIIMMSQNRRSEKDRIDANAAYNVALKMELEITRLHQRFDALEEVYHKQKNQ